MTDAWSSLLQTLLWMGLIGFFIFIFRKLIQSLPDIIKKWLEEGASFMVGPVSIGTPPDAIAKGEKGAVTSEGTGGISTSTELEVMMVNRAYPTGFSDEYYLVHSWETIQGSSSENRFWIRLWLEATSKRSLDHVSRVTYRLPQGFPRQVVATEAKGRNFELWFNTSKEINVMANVEMDDKTSIWLNRHVTLPDRPQGQSLPIDFEVKLDIMNASPMEPAVVYGEGSIRISWEIPALDVNLQGYWEIFVVFDPIINEQEYKITETVPASLSNKSSLFMKDIVFNHESLSTGLYSIIAGIHFNDNNNKPVALIGVALEQKQIYFVRNIPPALRHSTMVSVEAHLMGSLVEEENIFEYDTSWLLRIEWVTRMFSGNLQGYWQPQVRFIPLGPGDTTILKSESLPISITPDQQTEHQLLDLPVEAHCVMPGVYKVVIVVTNIDLDMNATDVIGFYEVPSPIQVVGPDSAS